MLSSSDSDVIEATPEFGEDIDIIGATPQKCLIKKNTKKRPKKKKEIIESFQESLHLIEGYGIEETSAGSVHYNKPYVYFEIKELVCLMERKCVLKHNAIHVVGFYKYCSVLGQILTEDRETEDASDIIKLDFKLLKTSPIEGDVISIYGNTRISFEEGYHQPSVMVNFFRTENDGYSSQYKKTLKIVRSFVPRCFFETIDLKN